MSQWCDSMIAGGFYLWISWSLALLFAVSGFAKIVHAAAFREHLAAYPFVPGSLISALAKLLPLMELTLAVGLVFVVACPGALLAAATLLAAYCAAVGIAWWMGAGGADCGCGAGSEVPIGGWLLLRNLLLLVFALCGMALAGHTDGTLAVHIVAVIGLLGSATVYDWINVFIRSEYETD